MTIIVEEKKEKAWFLLLWSKELSEERHKYFSDLTMTTIIACYEEIGMM